MLHIVTWLCQFSSWTPPPSNFQSQDKPIMLRAMEKWEYRHWAKTWMWTVKAWNSDLFKTKPGLLSCHCLVTQAKFLWTSSLWEEVLNDGSLWNLYWLLHKCVFVSQNFTEQPNKRKHFYKCFLAILSKRTQMV